jgi:hypothetical protein
MPRWVSRVLKRIRERAAAFDVRLTHAAQRDALLLGLSPDDVRETVAGLGARDSIGRLASSSTGEWMYVFKPDVGGRQVYVKLVLRKDCVVVSFHEDQGGGHEEDA